MATNEFAYVGAAELARRIRTHALSPVELMDATIARVEARNPSLNALIFTDFDGARAAAQQAESAVMSGAALPPLHGVPAAIKDLFDFKPGWPTTFGGVRALKDNIAQFHCVFAERIERGGAILIGKTNAPTMGFRGITDNYLFGATSNPFDVTRNPGGSSGGSAAAVADGLLPLAEGTDAGGSIRIPAAWCNVYGYKASFGRVPVVVRPNAFSAYMPFVFEGPITRSVEDAALTMTVLGGYDRRDPLSLDETVDYLGALTRPVKGMRIGYSPNLDVFPVDPRVAAVVKAAAAVFAEAGAEVEEISLGLKTTPGELSDLWSRMMMPLNLGTLEATKAGGLDLLGDHRDDFPPEFLRWIELGQKLSAADLRRDQEKRSEFYDAIQDAFENYDLLVTPTLGCLPVKNQPGGNTVGPREINGEAVDPMIGWCLTYPFNFTGHPAASIPAGLVDGLPVGMQIIGRRYADVDVIAASATFERLQPWSGNYAICERREIP
jgi:amidase